MTPYDGSPVDVVDHTHLAVTVIYCVLGILGLVFTVVCLVFNLMFKNKRLVHVHAKYDKAPTHTYTLTHTHTPKHIYTMQYCKAWES